MDRKNLRVILSLDHSNDEFAARCASNPALFSKCHVIWMDGWARESMQILV